jgi:hypothetical protein
MKAENGYETMLRRQKQHKKAAGLWNFLHKINGTSG